MNQLDLFVEIVGNEEYGVGRYWMVDSTGVLVDSFDLASFPGATDGSTTRAEDINNHGTIVGFEYHPDLGFIRPLVWATPESLPVELPVPDTAYWPLAAAINDEGLVIGRWSDDNGQNLVAWKLSVSDGSVTVLDSLVIVTAPNVHGMSTTNSGYVSYTAEGPRDCTTLFD
jgi:uncharacterized membrane protein